MTRYEASNAIWKLGLARDELCDPAIDDAIEILDRLNHEMNVESATGPSTMEAARASGLTFCDACSLTVARREEFTLVTEDSALREATNDQGVSTAQIQSFE